MTEPLLLSAVVNGTIIYKNATGGTEKGEEDMWTIVKRAHGSVEREGRATTHTW